MRTFETVYLDCDFGSRSGIEKGSLRYCVFTGVHGNRFVANFCHPANSGTSFDRFCRHAVEAFPTAGRWVSTALQRRKHLFSTRKSNLGKNVRFCKRDVCCHSTTRMLVKAATNISHWGHLSHHQMLDTFASLRRNLMQPKPSFSLGMRAVMRSQRSLLQQRE